jgi:hypothetical protein
MESTGGRPLDFNKPSLEKGDVMIVPTNNSNVQIPSGNKFHLAGTLRLMPFQWASTMNRHTRAGFYSDVWGALPFSIGSRPAEEFRIFQFRDS